MDYSEEFFLCDSCQNRDFIRIYNFALRFHGVNFSDELIYDRLTDEIYQCTKCQKTFTIHEVEQRLTEIKTKRRASYKGA
jgi:hypothetical protein